MGQIRQVGKNKQNAAFLILWSFTAEVEFVHAVIAGGSVNFLPAV